MQLLTEKIRRLAGDVTFKGTQGGDSG